MGLLTCLVSVKILRILDKWGRREKIDSFFEASFGKILSLLKKFILASRLSVEVVVVKKEEIKIKFVTLFVF